MKKLIFILPLLYYSCTDDIVADIDALQTENAEQDAQIDSLLTVITTQQEYIDSMNNVQNAYIDSLISESSLNDSLLQVYTDSLNTVQNTLNADQQAYIDSLNGVQQTLIDALISTQPSTGENYVRIDSVQICWDSVSGVTGYGTSGITVNFPINFTNIPYVIVQMIEQPASSVGISNLTSTSVTFAHNWSGGQSINCDYVAIGKWQ